MTDPFLGVAQREGISSMRDDENKNQLIWDE